MTSGIMFFAVSGLFAQTAQDVPGTIDLTKGDYQNGVRTENGGDNVGYVKNGGKAIYLLNVKEEGVYNMSIPVTIYNGGTVTMTLEDAATGAQLSSFDWTIPNVTNYTPCDVILPAKISGQVKLTFDISSPSDSWVFNYKAMTFTNVADDVALVSALSVNDAEASKGDAYDWAVNIPANYSDPTISLKPTVSNGSLSVSAEDGNGQAVEVTDAGSGLYTIPTPAPGAEAIVTFALTPDSSSDKSVIGVKDEYTLRIYHIGEDFVTALHVDNLELDEEALAALNSAASYSLTERIFTSVPVVKVEMNDKSFPEVTTTKVSETSYKYTFTGTGGKAFTLHISEGFYFYTPSDADETISLRYSKEDLTDDGWSKDSYSILGVNDGWGGNQFKYRTNTDYTISVPNDVIVKKLTFGQLGDNYSDGEINYVKSEGATLWIPTSTKFFMGSANYHDLDVVFENHQAGTPIVFNFASGSQPVAWIDLIYEKASDTSAIDSVAVNASDEAVEYFNLQGIRVDMPSNGIFIRRQGNTVSKVVL